LTVIILDNMTVSVTVSSVMGMGIPTNLGMTHEWIYGCVNT